MVYKEIYCNNCKQMVEPQKNYNKALLIILCFLGLWPGIAYYYFIHVSCPICKSKNWGIKPQE